MKSSQLVFFFLFFTLTFNGFSQSIINIRGKVLDKKTGKPISFATILLKKNSLGLYANYDGDFGITKNDAYKKDTLIFTSIGYQKKYLPFKNLSTSKENIIYLEEANERLNGITISTKRRKRTLSSKQIIRRAIKKIPENYPTKPKSYISYYRDYLKKNKKYYNLDEAIIQTIDSGFLKPSVKNNFRLIEYKKNKKFPRITYIPEKYDSVWQTPDYGHTNKYIPYAKLKHQGGNELFILLTHDPIRNFKTNSFSFIYNFSKDFLRNHSFKKYKKVYSDNIELYKIEFYTRKITVDRGKIPNYYGEVPERKSHYVITPEGDFIADAVLVEGEIYINPKDYTIHKLHYSGFLESTKKKIYELSLEYGYTDFTEEQMHLKYISFNNEFFTIDLNDKNFFRVLATGRKEDHIVLKTNSEIDLNYSKNKQYYNVTYDNKKIKVDKIEINGNRIRLYFKDKSVIKLGLKIEVRDVRDVKGRKINERKVIAFYQFRELFVQEYNRDVEFINKCFLTNMPLHKNCLSKIENQNIYFMNTPLKTRE